MKLGLRLGKKPARPNAVRFLMSTYVDRSKLPPIPENFGHDGLVGADWQMLANDAVSDCVFAGAAHETVLWNKMAGRDVTFTDQGVISDYAAVTGYNPADPNSDQGSDMQQAAEYRRTVGIVDAAGVRHKIAAYLAIDAKSLTDLWAACYLFGVVGIGLELPATAEDRFHAGQLWYDDGSPPIGGHYVVLTGKRGPFMHLVTWGRVQLASFKFIQRCCDEACAYVSEEALIGGRSVEGFDQAALLADLAALKGAA